MPQPFRRRTHLAKVQKTCRFVTRPTAAAQSVRIRHPSARRRRGRSRDTIRNGLAGTMGPRIRRPNTLAATSVSTGGLRRRSASPHAHAQRPFKNVVAGSAGAPQFTIRRLGDARFPTLGAGRGEPPTGCLQPTCDILDFGGAGRSTLNGVAGREIALGAPRTWAARSEAQG